MCWRSSHTGHFVPPGILHYTVVRRRGCLPRDCLLTAEALGQRHILSFHFHDIPIFVSVASDDVVAREVKPSPLARQRRDGQRRRVHSFEHSISPACRRSEFNGSSRRNCWLPFIAILFEGGEYSCIFDDFPTIFIYFSIAKCLSRVSLHILAVPQSSGHDDDARVCPGIAKVSCLHL